MNMEHFKAGHVKYELDTKAELSYMCVNSDPKIKKKRERERETWRTPMFLDGSLMNVEPASKPPVGSKGHHASKSYSAFKDASDYLSLSWGRHEILMHVVIYK